jgi:acetyl-CoA synthetase
MSDTGSFYNRSKEFSWDQVIQELDLSFDNFNIGWICSDRICNEGKADNLALHFEGFDRVEENYTFNDVRQASNKIGAFLKELGVTNGDRVCLFMDKIPELYFSFLGILKIGSIVQPLFSAFGDESLFVRLNNAETKVIITQKKHLPKIRKIQNRLSIKHIIIVDQIKDTELKESEIAFDLISYNIDNVEIFPATAETPSVLQYTSGTTGQPKGALHVHKSLVSQYITTKWILDLKGDDKYWCTADPGWITGTSYGIIGPWSLGVSQYILDLGFSAQAWYKFIEKNRITVWYTSPTAIRSLMKAGEAIIRDYDLSSLRHMASVGEPLNPEAVVWSIRNFGKPFHDTFWQTETGAIMISNYPGMEVKPGSMGKPVPGIKAAVLDPVSFEPLSDEGQIGMIAFRPDWPSMMRTYWNNPEKYKEKFVNGWYLTGDKARIDQDGYYWFIGRDDDVINTGGHLISPFEVESALLEHPQVAESAVVSKPDEINMEVVKAYITLKPGYIPDKNLELDIMNFIRKKLSSFAMPQEIEFIDKLPKTRSGKIMRRLLHAKEWNLETGDTLGLEDD